MQKRKKWEEKKKFWEARKTPLARWLSSPEQTGVREKLPKLPVSKRHIGMGQEKERNIVRKEGEKGTKNSKVWEI